MRTLLTVATAALMTLAAVDRVAVASLAADDRAAGMLAQVRTASGERESLSSLATPAGITTRP